MKKNCCDNHERSEKCMFFMYELRPNLCDVHLLTDDGERIAAHRVVIAAALNYFNAMLTGSGVNGTEYIESNQREILIKNIDGTALNAIVKWCYTGRVLPTEDNVQQLLSGAKMLDCTEIVNVCTEFIIAQLHPENAIGIFAFAEMLGCLDLQQQSLNYIYNCFAQIAKVSEEFFQLSSGKLSEIIASDFLDTGEQGEQIVLDCVMQWIEHDHAERKQYLPMLAQHVRFPRLPQEKLISIEDEYPILKTDTVCKDLLIEAMKFHLIKNQHRPQSLLLTLQQQQQQQEPDQQQLLQTSTPSSSNLFSSHSPSTQPSPSQPLPPTSTSSSAAIMLLSSSSSSSSPPLLSSSNMTLLNSNERFRMRCPKGRPKCLLVIGGQAPKAIRQCEYYDFASEKWCDVQSELPSRRCRAGVAVLNGVVYAIGGFNGTLRVRTVDCFDQQTNKWLPCANMEARRSTLGVCVLNNKIYAIGGFDGSFGLQTAEVFDPITTSWSFIASMTTKRSSVGVAALGEHIYAVGGYDGASRQCLSSVERYDPQTDSWQLTPDMSQRRSGAGVGVLDNKLYAIGGHDGPAVRKSVECYDPAQRTWTQCADMIVARRNAGVVSRDGLLYVVGGDDGTSNLASVEIYDPKLNSWQLLAQRMSIGRSYAGVCIVDKISVFSK